MKYLQGRTIFRWFMAAVLGLALAQGLASGARARAVYGLIVGIDDYAGSNNDLAGAVNDANDIAGALRALKARQIIKLTDAGATKRAIASGWFELVSKAQPGDTIIFTYAGHGAQEPEPAGRNGEVDGKNENFLLAGFAPTGPGRKERIVDDEIFEWLKMADDKNIQVIFLADSCHSGSMTRSARATGVKFRKGNFGAIKFDEDLLANFPPPEIARITERDFKNVTFIAATQEGKLVPEVMIDGQPRGALSWAFARALEGAADFDNNGELTQIELVRYLVPAVHQRVETQQTPEVRPLRLSSQAIMAVGRPSGAFAPANSGVKLKLAILDGNGPALAAISDLAWVSLVDDPAEADLIWNVRTGTMEHKIGGKVAERVSAKSAKGVLAKWSAIKALKARAHKTPAAFTLTTGNHRYQRGSTVSLEMRGAILPHLTMFNLAPNGRVEFFIPTRSGEAGKDWRGQVIQERFKVAEPPYGAEHLIAIFTDEVLSGLHAALARMKTVEQANELPGLLEQFLKGRKFQLGIAGIYTGGEG